MSSGLRGGSIKFFLRRFVVLFPIAIKSCGIESRGLGLSPEPKIMSKLVGSSEIGPLEVEKVGEKRDFPL